ncbi:sulfur carrier protein [Pseudonocardia thermophila]|jgi:Sulfur transfer protein involved in thiamine biosynthesis|uniref:Sulfur carrier protein n=1 Tax=Pseudonocardia thermophila TaxID=1848 RepID=A0A1M7A5J8_PSETH|nr:MoaD/ThiS family protein [Pseudonocardia thermophila]SHL37997.1 sulfur carrier protein [Pseudonocardia thermophila]
MKIRLHNPRREVETTGPLRASDLCKQLGLNRESVLLIRGDELVTGDALLQEEDVVEVRPVISGG